MKCFVVHYSEIGLKGGNRDFFEKKLMDNIRTALSKYTCTVSRLYGRIMVEYSGKSQEAIASRLERVPGVSGFSFSIGTGLDEYSIVKAVDSMASGVNARTFAVSTVRSLKNFPKTSREMNEMLGDHVRKMHGWKVDLTNPDVTFHVEITEKHAFVYTDRRMGMGGLPVSSSGRVISLISGGIDSPVAALEMMKRGCSVVFVHFHNWTGQKDVVRDKVKRLVKQLSAYQPSTKLYMVPFGDLQKEITMKIPAKYRMIVYRRIMFMIAGRIAAREKALGFVTGDSVGQVASQTLENLAAIYDRAGLPVFSPLIGSNKEEITSKAKKAGTYDISILPYSDCCSFLVAKHPETRASKSDIEKSESLLDIDDLIKSALKGSEKVRYRL